MTENQGGLFLIAGCCIEQSPEDGTPCHSACSLQIPETEEAIRLVSALCNSVAEHSGAKCTRLTDNSKKMQFSEYLQFAGKNCVFFRSNKVSHVSMVKFKCHCFPFNSLIFDPWPPALRSISSAVTSSWHCVSFCQTLSWQPGRQEAQSQGGPTFSLQMNANQDFSLKPFSGRINRHTFILF